MTITYGSVCSGIEAATVAWHPLGLKAAWYAEIEPFPCAVLAHHYPGTPNHGDMTRLAAMVLAGKIPAPEVLVGGTPCQAFSVAGMREGLADPRGALTIKYVELLDAIDHVRTKRGQPEAACLWENVPGVLSDKGNAFGCFLGALVGESEELQPPGGKWKDAGCVYGPTRTVAWRVLDAQYFGLAQRRRRVFVVASARAGFDPAAVLFEFEGVRRDTPPRREPGQVAAGTLASRTGAGGFPGTDEACSGYVQPVAFSCKDYGADAGVLSPTLRAMGHGASHANAGGQVAVAFAIQAGALRTNPKSGPGGMGVQADHAYTLEARAEVQAVCITGDITHTLKAEGFDASEDGTGRGQPIIAFQPGNLSRGAGSHPSSSVFPTLKADHGRGASDQDPHVMQGSAVRRLTPRECERLMGFPDNHTRIPYRGKPAEECPDGPRYKAIGNSKAVFVVRWIGRRIQRQLEALQ